MWAWCFSFEEKRDDNFKVLLLLSFKLIERVIICCTNIIINPSPNSTADKIKKKKVKDSIFKLSNTNPTKIHITYKVIQRSSAVNKRCNAVLMFNIILVNITKNKMKIKFISPKTIIYIT